MMQTDDGPLCVPSTSSSTDDGQNRRAQVISSVKSFLFILGTALVMFVAFRNTVTWHLQCFWGASGNFWQSHWEKVLYLFGENEYSLSVWECFPKHWAFLQLGLFDQKYDYSSKAGYGIRMLNQFTILGQNFGTFLATFLVYWGAGLIYTFIDLTGKPAFLLRYKIQDNSPYPVKFSKVWHVVKQVLVNQILIGLPFAVVGYHLMKWRGYDNGVDLPTFQWVLLELTVFILMEEFGFYYSHRVLHHPKVYKYIHKRHHEWTSPIAITAVYCHPLEHIFSNLVPPYLGPLLMGSHTATSWLWFTIAILSTLNAHSGYHFPFFPSPEAHDFHHLKFNQNYGMLGVLDRLHGTDKQFRSSKVYHRHIMLLSLVPLKQLYPDNLKQKAE